jgi:MoxR-like ATPase
MDPSRLTRIVVSWEGQLTADKESRSQRLDEKRRLLYEGSKGKAVTSSGGNAQVNREGEKLYLAPDGSYSGSDHYHRGRLVEDRTNGGDGFTLEDLHKMEVQHPAHGRQNFRHWDGRDSYLADTNNWLMERVDFPSLMEPTRHKAVYINDCLREINRIRDDVSTYKTQVLSHIKAMERQIRTHLWVTDDFAKPAATSLGQTRHEIEALLSRIDILRKGIEMLPKEGEPSPDATAPSKKPEAKKTARRNRR